MSKSSESLFYFLMQNFVNSLILGVCKTFRAEDYHRYWIGTPEQFVTDNWLSI